MPELRPFRGLTYDPSVTGPIELQVAEPYDKVKPTMRRAYLARSPHNVVRVSLPEDEGGAGDAYQQAARRLRDWLESGALRRADAPGLYWYEQTFEAAGANHTRKAFFAIVEADDYGDGKVLPHERTYRVYKEERLRLLEEVRTHLGFVFLLYEDPEQLVPQTLADAAAGHEPLFAFETADGIQHRLTRVEAPEALASVTEHMRERTCVIADGHHRYETAVNFRRRREEAGEATAGHRFRLCALVEVSDPGLVVLATHRVLPKPGLDSLLRGTVDIVRSRPIEAEPTAENLEAALAGLAEAGPGAFVATDGQTAYELRLRDNVDLDAALAELVAPARTLDVAILHTLLLEQAMGIKTGNEGVKPFYTRTAAEAFERLDDEYGLAILMRPTPARAVLEVAHAGGTMPQKSTDFYPKLPSGLVMHDVEDAVHDPDA
jgi:uncharacterized protein (DUF1015 family)